MSGREPSGAAVGWISFAGILLIVGGSFAILAGLAGIINPDTFVVTKDNLLKVSTSTWGWWHLVVGAIVFFSGFGVFTGNVLARTVGVIAAIVSMISAFLYMSIYPIWGITIVADRLRDHLGAHGARPRHPEGRADGGDVAKVELASPTDRSVCPTGRTERLVFGCSNISRFNLPGSPQRKGPFGRTAWDRTRPS